ALLEPLRGTGARIVRPAPPRCSRRRPRPEAGRGGAGTPPPAVPFRAAMRSWKERPGRPRPDRRRVFRYGRSGEGSRTMLVREAMTEPRLVLDEDATVRSEERRVGKEGRARGRSDDGERG